LKDEEIVLGASGLKQAVDEAIAIESAARLIPKGYDALIAAANPAPKPKSVSWTTAVLKQA
jgi:hypothetical protein